jgi:hypothetical protein
VRGHAERRNISYVPGHRWLLLGHQLPTRSSNARVKTWRRLQQVGAVPARNSVYVLPNTDQCREDFEWIRSEIVALGGEATVFAADAISDGGTEDIIAAFQRARDEEYRSLKADVDRLAKSKRRLVAARNGQGGRLLRSLRDRFGAIERTDFFDALARPQTAEALAALERATAGRRTAPPAPHTSLNPEDFRGRRWVTRRRPGVDRMASAWLIRRFIDPTATFVFADRPGDDGVPFDMYTGEFSHHGDLCTFEVLADRFSVHTGAAVKVGQIVHDLDMKELKYGLPEATAVGRMVDGLRALHADDQILLERGIAMFDALARSFESDDATRSASKSKRPVAPKPRRRGRNLGGRNAS